MRALALSCLLLSQCSLVFGISDWEDRQRNERTLYDKNKARLQEKKKRAQAHQRYYQNNNPQNDPYYYRKYYYEHEYEVPDYYE